MHISTLWGSRSEEKKEKSDPGSESAKEGEEEEEDLFPPPLFPTASGYSQENFPLFEAIHHSSSSSSRHFCSFFLPLFRHASKVLLEDFRVAERERGGEKEALI